MTMFFGVSGKDLYIKDLAWRFLSEFILDKCQDVIREDEKQDWQENYGKMISHETAVAIADQLERLIQQGVVERFRTELEFGNLGQHFTEETLKRFIQFCRVSSTIKNAGRCAFLLHWDSSSFTFSLMNSAEGLLFNPKK